MQKIGDIPNTRADSNGEFTDGNVAGGVPPTILPAEWFNTIQRELMSILTAAEIEADSDTFNQVLLSIQKLIGEEIPDIKDASLTQKGVVQLSNATNSTSEILAATPKAVRAVDVAALKIANNLSEINAVGAIAIAQTLTNLGLSDVAHLPQLTGIVGTARNAKMSIPAASVAATFTADELIVQAALGGRQYKLASFNKTINLATTGAGGMDTGAVPANGFVALYAIYNPTTQVSALLAVNATSVLVPEVYSGANMPSGYTASALVSIWKTASSQLVIGYQMDRKITLTSAIAINGNTQQAAYTAIPLTPTVPVNAKTVSGTRGVASTTAGAAIKNYVASSASGLSEQPMSGGTAAANLDMHTAFLDLPIITPQTIYFLATASAGTMTMSVVISSYTF
ncbi:tail fiber protein [Yersinia mollaretii]|uniref:Tail fiber protein n=2 Tax=Yersinia TaxID=629 RepID=A0AA36LPU1_YERMO|nr:phage tail protein [Yersinia mollaretii]CNI12242.1 tail fiber protein [Yersinia mollaretii]